MSELHRRATDTPEPASATPDRPAPERIVPDRRTDDDRPDTPDTLRSHTDFTGATKDQSPEPDKAKDRGGNNDKPDRNVRLTVDGKPLHEHLDPAGAGARDHTIGDRPSDKRTGDHIAEAESDRPSGADKIRKSFYKNSSKYRNAVQEYGGPADAVRHPPTGHPVVDTRPTLDTTPHQGPSLPSLALGFAALGAVLYESGRKVIKNVSDRRGNGDAG